MKIFAVETSCDETSLALIDVKNNFKLNSNQLPKFRVLKNLVSSQIKIHAPYGGVVPNLAKREHLKNLPILFKKISGANLDDKNAKIKNFLKSIDLITVTSGPGLEPALWTGINFVLNLKNIYKQNNLTPPKIIGSNHLLGHLYSFLFDSQIKTKKISSLDIFPAIALIVSGGHTILLKVNDLLNYKKLGETLDDACGEAFDKVARMLNLGYPGGPLVEKLGNLGNPKAINFPRPMLNQKSYNFSFSGLKTSVLYYLRDHKNVLNDEKLKADVCASFEEAAFDVLIQKSKRAIKEFNAKSILLSGGVAANKLLRKKIKKMAKEEKVLFFAPPFIYNTDNAAMIAVAAYILFLKNKGFPLKARGDLNI